MQTIEKYTNSQVGSLLSTIDRFFYPDDLDHDRYLVTYPMYPQDNLIQVHFTSVSRVEVHVGENHDIVAEYSIDEFHNLFSDIIMYYWKDVSDVIEGAEHTLKDYYLSWFELSQSI